jgi:uncharacterized C2H2 Zn-finger protein
MPNRRRNAHAQRWHVPRHNVGSRPVVLRRPGRIRRWRRRLHAGVSIRILAQRIHANMAAVGRFQRPKPRPLHASIMASLRHRTRVPNQTARRTGRHALRHAPCKAVPKQQHSRTRHINASHGTQGSVRPSSLSASRVTSTLCYLTRTLRHVPVGSTRPFPRHSSIH